MKVETDSKQLPSYEQPPLIEVVCSVQFSSLEGLLSPHLGVLWQRFQPDYPFCDDLTPITPKIEFSEQQKIEQVTISNIPELPRVWFINQDGTRIIQIQRDRFIYNWRKVDPDNEYPRYNLLIQTFQDHLAEFNRFVKEAELGQIQPYQQYELTYINQIHPGQIWQKPEDIGKVFPDISWQGKSSRFLNNPDSISWGSVFNLPEQIGRLYASVKPAIFNEKSTLVFELTVRGIGGYTSSELLPNWFDIAHEWIVSAFADLTDQETQINIWKRRG